MNSDIIVAAIGALASVFVAWLANRKAPSTQGSAKLNNSFTAVLAVGLAITAIFLSVIPPLQVVSTTIAAHTAGTKGQDGTPHYEAPRVPADEQRHVIDVRCPFGYEPVSAWHEVVGSHPSVDTMYTVNPVVEGTDLVVYLRSRKDTVGGYLYAEIFLLCGRFGI